MCGSYGKQVLYSVTRLYMDDIDDMCKGLAAKHNMQTPMIDVDRSNICYLTKWAKMGVKVTVSDGKCSISKQPAQSKQREETD